MKIRLTKPFAQAGRVIPAGVIIADAPPGLKERLVREGRAEVYPPAEKKAPKGKGRKKNV